MPWISYSVIIPNYSTHKKKCGVGCVGGGVKQRDHIPGQLLVLFLISSHSLLARHIHFMVMSFSRLTLPVLGSLCSKGWLCSISQAFPFGERVVAMAWKCH